MTLAQAMRQLLWRDEVDRLLRELADREATERAAREADEAKPEGNG